MTTSSCEECQGRGYVVTVDGALAVAGLCSACRGSCPDCEDERTIPRINSRGYEFLEDCHCKGDHDRLERFNWAKIPARHAECTLETFKHLGGNQREVRQRCGKHVDGYFPGSTGLVLSGSVGTGKTHLLVSILRTLALEHGQRVGFVEFTHLLSELKEGFDRGRSEAEVLGRVTRIPVLGVDELGKGLTTDWQLSILDEVISRRYNQRLTTYFTTNLLITAVDSNSGRVASSDSSRLRRQLEQAQLHERVGDRIFSRLNEMCMFIPVNGPDARTL